MALRVLLLFLLLAIARMDLPAQNIYHAELLDFARSKESVFPFGVASGDPRPDRVVLWTKVFPKREATSVSVTWIIASDTNLTKVVSQGDFLSDAKSAFTVSVEPTGLKPGTTYFYCFVVAGDSSAIGRTRTAPEQADKLRFVVASCANYGDGYFNAYGHMAQQQNIDAVLFLGDYIYEYGTRSDMIRGHLPNKEILTLQDYRTRYAQYRLDPQLQEAHRLHPFIAIWDDHEFANNSFADGAQNHNPNTEGNWNDRKAIARQVFFEWLPVMRSGEQKTVRELHYGNLADLFMIDGRVEGRSDPIADYMDPARYDTSRSMLGKQQLNWLIDGLTGSTARWPMLVNNVMFAPMDLGSVAKERRFNMDAWDGYPMDRERIFDALERKGMNNLIVVTGDIHTSWAVELVRDPKNRQTYDRRTGKGVMGAEFVTPSITSHNLDEMKGKMAAKIAVPYMRSRKRNPHLRFVNMKDHGYLVVTLTDSEAKGEWVYMKTLLEPSLKTKASKEVRYYGTQLMKGRK
jgi:alkaline phosphatase D